MGTLQVVATPIGNLEDISARGLRTLAEADLFFAEDTRRVRILLDRYDVKAQPLSLHEHNEASRIETALGVLRAGGRVALVSDAGTPLVSDPGARLVAASIDDGHEVEAIPGPSAVIAALTISGFSAAPFTFVGFLPRRAGLRRALLESYRGRPETMVFFESPRRLAATLGELAEILGDRRGCVARELTKLHEEAVRGRLLELAARFADGARGEVTLVVEGDDADAAVARGTRTEPLDDQQLEARIRELLAAGRRPREIAAQLASSTGAPRRQLYARVLALKDQQ